MPEIDSLMITADLVNNWSHNKEYQWIRQDKTSKNKLVLNDPLENPFTIRAESRGKEFKLNLNTGSHIQGLMFTFGMSGYWLSGDISKPPNHTKVAIINTDKQQALYFIDVRRFGNWHWGTWGDKRGPDPIKEFDLFKQYVLSNLHKRIFKKPICEMLMNQQYFNGIGNYLRAMICYEAGCNPFMPSNQALVEYPQIFDYCRGMALQAYIYNANKLKIDHGMVNPYPNRPIEKFNQWKHSTYRNHEFALVVDKGNRVMWYHPQWVEEAHKTYPEPTKHQPPKGYLK